MGMGMRMGMGMGMGMDADSMYARSNRADSVASFDSTGRVAYFNFALHTGLGGRCRGRSLTGQSP